MNSHKQVLTLTMTALLIAVGTVIPLFMPKVIIGPMSFTLASHVAIMIALFLSPAVAVAVALGTTLGFFLAGFPFVVVMRALTHVIWAYLGSKYAQKHPNMFKSSRKTWLFNFAIAVIHTVGEMIIVIPFYYAGMDIQTFLYMIVGLVGIGTMVHSSVDFFITTVVWKVLAKNSTIAGIANVKTVYLLKNA